MKRILTMAACSLLIGMNSRGDEPATKVQESAPTKVTPWVSKDTPLLDHLIFTCELGKVDQEKFDGFLKTLGTALTTKDVKRLNDCFYWADTPEPLHDLAIYEFEQLLSNKKVYAITVCRLEDRRVKGGVKLYASGKIMNGHHYDPNLKPIYMAVMLFHDPNCPTCKDEMKWLPIGQPPDGSYRFPGTKVASE